jgi:hypothetical protein
VAPKWRALGRDAPKSMKFRRTTPQRACRLGRLTNRLALRTFGRGRCDLSIALSSLAYDHQHKAVAAALMATRTPGRDELDRGCENASGKPHARNCLCPLHLQCNRRPQHEVDNLYMCRARSMSCARSRRLGSMPFSPKVPFVSFQDFQDPLP